MWSRPAVSTSTRSAPRALAASTASKATAAGSAPWPCRTTCESVRSPHTQSCSTAAARKVSPAPRITLSPRPWNCAAIFPMVVVLPAPLTPTTRTTWGRTGPSSKWPSSSTRISSIRFRRWAFSASVSASSFRSTRALTSATSFMAVETPMSAVTSASSRASRASASTVLRPKRARSIPLASPPGSWRARPGDARRIPSPPACSGPELDGAGRSSPLSEEPAEEARLLSFFSSHGPVPSPHAPVSACQNPG